MKKRKLVYVGAVAVGLSLSACSDSFLDMNNYGAYDDFNSETKVTWYLAGLYSNYYNTYNSPVQELVGAWGSTDWTYMTDEEWGIHTGTKIDPNSSYGTIDDIKSWEVSSGKYEDPMLSGYFGDRLGSSVKNNAYTRIRNCNILLRDIDNATVSKETRQRAKGQALFLRAVQLFDLVRIYGPVPIVTEVINAEATDNGLPRASVTQCVSQIVKDLNEAAGYLPASWNGNDAGRPTRLTALAYKSRVLLFYASPIFNKFPAIAKNTVLINFIGDTLRVYLTTGDPADIDSLMKVDMQTIHEEGMLPAHSVSHMAESMPGMGIVACVLGVVLTMGKINEPPEVLGHHIGAALVGTFFGILCCYGLFGPMGSKLENYEAEEHFYFNAVKEAVSAAIRGATPLIAVEYGRRAIPYPFRPKFSEMEDKLKS